MDVIEVDIAAESQRRYLTYALSVVSSRALPDVRDGLKPVQRRILYTMVHQLGLTPEKHHRKSAAVVGEVLGRFHPHGDSACYEAMVRMAQDFSLRYPLVDGQGNFGSMDGDAAAAYRYTEARLMAIAMEVIGDIGQETVAERDNFDQTLREPVVLPSRLPNLLMNGASGIAVGMATAIPPHNLKELTKALLIMIEDEDAPDSKIFGAVKGPDFPTGCEILNTPAELREIYRTGRGPIRMRGAYRVEEGKKGKSLIVVSSIPYGIDKSVLVEKIADSIVARKLPQLVDVRDESTDDVRIVMELAPGADADKAMAYLFKNTTLQHNFHVNLTALVPTDNPTVSRPSLLSLRDMLLHFLRFRVDVIRRRLNFEKGKLEERIHLLEGLILIIDVLDEVIAIVRKSDGRSDAAQRLQARFGLSELQALFVVDLRMYQLSKTSVTEIRDELKEKSGRVAAIRKIVGSEKLLKAEVASELSQLVERFGDARRSPIIAEFAEVEYDKDEYVQHELACVVVTRDGWLKRIRATNDPATTRVREGDAISFSAKADTRDALAIVSNLGNLFVSPVFDVASTTGFGEPVQKMFRFQDGEQIAACLVIRKEQFESGELAQHDLLLCTERGLGLRIGMDQITPTKKTGKRLMKVAEGDQLRIVQPVTKELLLLVTADGYGVYMLASEIPKLTGAGKGVIVARVPDDDRLVIAAFVERKTKLKVQTEQGGPKEIEIGALTVMGRAKRGLKVVKRGLPVVGLATVPDGLFAGLSDGKGQEK